MGSGEGADMAQVAAGMKWQAACLRAMARNQPPPPPPANLNLETLLAGASANEQSNLPSMSAMTERVQVQAHPFTDEALQEPMVQQEFVNLCRDHQQLNGNGYHGAGR